MVHELVRYMKSYPPFKSHEVLGPQAPLELLPPAGLTPHDKITMHRRYKMARESQSTKRKTCHSTPLSIKNHVTERRHPR